MALKQKGKLVLGCTPEHEYSQELLSKWVRRGEPTQRVPNNLYWCSVILCNKFTSKNVEWREAVRRAYSGEPWQTTGPGDPSQNDRREWRHIYPSLIQHDGKAACLCGLPPWHSSQFNHEKNHQTNWNSRTLYKIPDPSKDQQNLENSHKLSCPRRHGN